MPALERVRELAMLLGVADPQGLTARGIPPVTAYGVEAYSLALLEERHPTLTAAMVIGVLDFWYQPRAAWALSDDRGLTAFLATVKATRPWLDLDEVGR